jgi:hypothetical protein
MIRTANRPRADLGRVLAELDAELRQCDYLPGPPPWLRAECVEIDRQVCAGGSCERCGHAGLLYRPFHKPEGRGQYRAFAVCPGCGDWSEF